MADDTATPTSADLRSRLEQSASELRELRSTPADKRGDTFAADLANKVNEVRSMDAEFTIAQRLEQDELQRIAFQQAVDLAAAGPESRGPSAAFHIDDRDDRTAGQQFVDSEFYSERRMSNANGVEVRNLLTGTSLGTSGSHAFVPVASPFLPPQGVRQRAFRLRDLLGSGQTGLPNSIPYIREVNALTNEAGAATVQEASAKPEATMQFEPADAPVRKIAAWVQATMEAYEDAPTLASYVDNRLAYMLLIEEEAQILDGDGSAPNLEGIRQVTGVQTQNAINDDVPATIGLSIAKVENVDGAADGIAINPITFWTGLVERHSGQMDGGVFSGALPFGTAPSTMFGLPVVRTRALDTNEALVGSWALGASLYAKGGIEIRTTDSHASLFISNTLVILAEERVALPVFRPDFFVDATLNFT